MNVTDKILVTGAAGMLGRAVVQVLEKAGFDRLLTPGRKQLDLADDSQVEAYMAEERPDYVFHLASLVFGLKGNLQNQLRSLNENTRIYGNLLSVCERFPPKKVFFAGTVASYPYPFRSLPLREEDFFMGLPHGGEFGYAMAKRHAYAYLDLLKSQQKVDFVYGLFTNLYGEHDTFDIENGHVIPSLICKAVDAAEAGRPTFQVWGNPAATRDFLYVQDAARAAVSTMESVSGLVNIASGSSISMKELAFGIAACLDDTVVPVWDAAAPVGILSRSIAVDRLRESGFVPEYAFDQAIANSVAWYRNHGKNT